MVLTCLCIAVTHTPVLDITGYFHTAASIPDRLDIYTSIPASDTAVQAFFFAPKP
jgi:hypothetical protein